MVAQIQAVIALTVRAAAAAAAAASVCDRSSTAPSSGEEEEEEETGSCQRNLDESRSRCRHVVLAALPQEAETPNV